MLEDASRRAENRAMIAGARADAASLAFNECHKPDWEEYAAAQSALPPEAARRWERSLEAHSETVQKLADAMVATGKVAAAAAQERAAAGRLASSVEADLYAAQEKEEVKAAAAREAAWSLAAARAAMLREVSAAAEPEPEPEPEPEDEEAECERLGRGVGPRQVSSSSARAPTASLSRAWATSTLWSRVTARTSRGCPPPTRASTTCFCLSTRKRTDSVSSFSRPSTTPRGSTLSKREL